MTDSGTGHDSTTATDSVLRVRGERTSAQRSKPAVPRPVVLQNAESNGPRKGATANMAILVCWLILLIVVLVALELHNRGLTRHSFLSQPQIQEKLEERGDSNSRLPA